jgi:hypothetical protein
VSADYASGFALCGKTIQRGEQVFYWPKGKTILCAGKTCGQRDSREFAVAACDEMSNRSL